MEQTQNNGVAEAPLFPEVSPPSPVAVSMPSSNPAIVGTLTKEEYLGIENLSLKVQNLGLQQQRMQAELIKANEVRQKMQSDLEAQQKALSAKYGVDLLARTTQITPDGVIIDLTRLPSAAAPKVD
jgi:hypothetical protein